MFCCFSLLFLDCCIFCSIRRSIRRLVLFVVNWVLGSIQPLPSFGVNWPYNMYQRSPLRWVPNNIRGKDPCWFNGLWSSCYQSSTFICLKKLWRVEIAFLEYNNMYLLDAIENGIPTVLDANHKLLPRGTYTE